MPIPTAETTTSLDYQESAIRNSSIWQLLIGAPRWMTIVTYGPCSSVSNDVVQLWIRRREVTLRSSKDDTQGYRQPWPGSSIRGPPYLIRFPTSQPPSTCPPATHSAHLVEGHEVTVTRNSSCSFFMKSFSNSSYRLDRFDVCTVRLQQVVWSFQFLIW